jgi:hypothetical protein
VLTALVNLPEHPDHAWAVGVGAAAVRAAAKALLGQVG